MVEEVVVHPALVAPVAQAVEAAGAPAPQLCMGGREVAVERRVRVAAVVVTAVLLVPPIRGAEEATVGWDMVARQEAMAAPLAEAFTPHARHTMRTATAPRTTPPAVAAVVAAENMVAVVGVWILLPITVVVAAVVGAI